MSKQRLPYPAHVPKEVRDRAIKYADAMAQKGTVGHERAFYDFINGALWGRDNPKTKAQ